MKLENNNKLNETYKTETYGLQTKNVCKKTKETDKESKKRRKTAGEKLQ